MSYQPKTGQKCGCRRGIERDNCPNCEGTGWVIDFKAIRERHALILAAQAVCQSRNGSNHEATRIAHDKACDELGKLLKLIA